MNNHLGGDLVRRLWSGDRGPLLDHLLRLDSDSRRNRFSGSVGDDVLRRYAVAALSDGLVYGFVEDGAVRGVGEIQFHAAGRGEAAFSVEGGWRQRGVGTQLFRRVLLAAANRRIRELEVRCLPRNEAMRALARKHGGRLSFRDDDIVGIVLPERPSPLSLAREAVAETLAWPLALADRRRPPRAA